MPYKLLIYLSLIFTSLSVNAVAMQLILPADMQSTLAEMQQKYQSNMSGQLATYIPELAKVNPHLFAIVVMTVDGKVYSAGDVDVYFPIESIVKPFIYALALMDIGEQAVNAKISLNATGHEFNSIKAIEESPDHLQNPLVNAGAIVITGMINGRNSNEKWDRTLTFIKMLSDKKIYLGNDVYQSEMATNQRNQAIAQLLDSFHLINNPQDDVDRYTKACSIMLNAKQLAMMAATLANDGINPITHQQVIPSEYVRDVLSQMVTNGMYENSGAWWYHVGLPAKSGVGGAIIAIVPGRMAIVVYSPLIDPAGNSIRAQQVINDISHQWHLHILDQSH